MYTQDSKVEGFDHSPRLNSHFPTLKMYERMLTMWYETDDPQNLTKENLMCIVAARVGPQDPSGGPQIAVSGQPYVSDPENEN